MEIEEITEEPIVAEQATAQLPKLERLADKLVFHEVAEDGEESLSTQTSEERITKQVSTNLIPYDDEVDL